MASTISAEDRIVVGVDGSTSSQAALRWAADEARRRGVGLHVVTCWDFPVLPVGPYQPPISAEELHREAREVAEKEIANVLGASGRDLDVSIAITEGPPSLTLLVFARTAAMVVVGSRGRGGFAGLLLGSVSQHLAEHARCPVVIVHGDEDAMRRGDLEGRAGIVPGP
ncbi:MAG: universal stress protein [Acidimicrobiia bacterium]